MERLDNDATGLAELVRRGDVHPRELVDEAIAAIEAEDGAIHAVVQRRFEQARDEARGPLPDGPFRGVPFLLKDYGAEVAGEPYHEGMAFLRDRGWRAEADSALAAAFRAAGLVNLGRTNLPELALMGTTEPVAAGVTHNPWALDRSPGGSSGGSAAAVAAGMVPAAHANDIAGSIRIPAADCGLVGLKPSRGASRRGRGPTRRSGSSRRASSPARCATRRGSSTRWSRPRRARTGRRLRWPARSWPRSGRTRDGCGWRCASTRRRAPRSTLVARTRRGPPPR